MARFVLFCFTLTLFGCTTLDKEFVAQMRAQDMDLIKAILKSRADINIEGSIANRDGELFCSSPKKTKIDWESMEIPSK